MNEIILNDQFEILYQDMSTVTGQLSKTTRGTYTSDMKHFASWMLQNNLSPNLLTYEVMIEYRQHLLDNFAQSTASRMLSVVRKVLDEQVKKGHLLSNPARDVRGIKTDDETTHTVLTKREAQELLSSIDRTTAIGKRDYALILLIFRLGLRRSECASLELSDISMDQGHNILIIRKGKGNKRRINKIPVDVKRAIDEYVKDRENHNIATIDLFTNVYVGDHHGNKKLSDKQICRIVKEYARKVNIENLTPHGLRGTFITLALEEKATLEQVQYAVGHKDSRTTQRYRKRKLNLDDNAVDYIKIN